MLRETVRGIRTELLSAELLVKLKKLALPGVDFEQVKQLARSAAEAEPEAKLGYAIIVGVKPAI